MTAVHTHSRKPYLLAFMVLVLLTVGEVAVVYVPGIDRALLISALVLMAVAKAGVVFMWFMHLATETRALRMTVLLPFTLPAAYAFVLIAEAAWRLPP